MESILTNINSPEEIKKLKFSQLEILAKEIREFLIHNVSQTGGHLASNLGVVELTLCLHRVFSTPDDKIVWDVGHQSYVHKILTGRKERFSTLRQFEGVAGFPKTSESIHDSFNTGHSSTSISAALGMAKARDILKDNYSVIAVIGDGALTGGMSFEALNDAGRSTTNIIVILNDNEMSITKNVGGLSKYLNRIRTEPFYFKVKEDLDIILNKIPAIGKSAAKALNKAKGSIKYMLIPGILFEELGFKYLGPIDGHNISELTNVLTRAKRIKGPVFIHVCTQKGKGYSFAEKKPHKFHGISPFDVETGEVKKNNESSYSSFFGKKLEEMAQLDDKITAITAAMPQGTGLNEFSKKFQGRFFDVGIAEQHAVTFAAGLAISGLKPVVAIYSSFLQRAYDQIIHDVALQNLHVVFAIDRAGIVGEDGETHQGLYDIPFLRHIPNMCILAPCDYSELSAMLEYAVFNHRGPIAIRYPRGKGDERLMETGEMDLGKGVRVSDGRDVSIISIGSMLNSALKATAILNNRGISVDLINARFIKPLDSKLIIESAKKTGRVITIEDGTTAGGFGSSVLELLSSLEANVKVKNLGFPDQPIEHGSAELLFDKYGLNPENIAEEVLKLINE